MGAYKSFLPVWNYILFGLAAILVVIGVFIIIRYLVTLQMKDEPKKKYDYIRNNSSKTIFNSILVFALALTLFFNTIYTSTVVLSVFWFFVRLFVSAAFGTLIIYITHLILKFAYPASLEHKLRILRYKPRINPKTGNKMKLLSEEEEDVHLDEGMQAEENVFSVDYDVWVDEKSGDVMIEKYAGHLQAHKCNTCGFMTMKQVKEEILVPPTQYEEGEIVKYFQCTYCGAKRSKILKIAKLSEDETHYEVPEHARFKEDDRIQSVSIEIHVGGGKVLTYEFQNTEQAGSFLKEFDLEDVLDN